MSYKSHSVLLAEANTLLNEERTQSGGSLDCRFFSERMLRLGYKTRSELKDEIRGVHDRRESRLQDEREHRRKLREARSRLWKLEWGEGGPGIY
ncbi:hypothetical protein CL634_09070 [bacterium]|nr:hypothetical protein [bacterium]|tara:strand:+ start:2714 stop:2995 length:282 start_codon:yes stop_codon:yes gene_type:complete